MTRKSAHLLFAFVAMLAGSLPTQAQRLVKGKVADAEGTELPGVSVVVKGKEAAGTTTSIDGRYAITANPTDTITFSYIGFTPQKEYVGNREVIDVVMREDENTLEETVVVAFAKQKKNSVIGSIETINPAELKTPSTNLTNTLAGRIAGIISYQRSGEPGKDNANFFVRGVSTINSALAGPLILIDGVEMSTEDLARLEPENIASFSIMKDATATALYGSKGANGVVLVTTKSGRKGKMKITTRLETQISTPTKILEFLDGVDYMNLYNYAQRTRDTKGLTSDAYLMEKIENTAAGTDPMLYPNVDWYGMMFKNQAINTKATITASGGGEVAQYYLSAAYTHENGLLKVPSVNNYNNNISINRYNIRANIDVNLTKTTKASVKVYSLLDRSNTPAVSTTTLFDQIMRANPVDFPAFYDKSIDNTWYYADHVLYGNAGQRAQYPNPYAQMMQGYSDAFSYTGNSIFTIEQDLGTLTPGLSVRGLASFSSTGSNTNTRRMTPFYYALVTNVSELGTKYSLNQIGEGTDRLSNPDQSLSTSSSYYFEVAAQWSRTFADHSLSAMLVGQQKEQLRGNAGGAFGSLPIRTMGLSGRLTYSYADRYFLEANFGYNGSEKFDKNHRWGFFPSIGVGYIISNEKFWSDWGLADIFPMWKFKASYGLVGNDNIMGTNERFYYLSDVNTSNSSTGYRWGESFGTVYDGYSITRYANSKIGWEAAKKQNYGVEVDLLGKANIQVEYFRETRDDIYQRMQAVPLTMGATADIYANMGKARSHGIDASFDINWSITRDWWLQTRFNFTYATSEYISGGDIIYPESWRNRMGYNLSQQWGYVAERLFIDANDVENSPRQFGLVPNSDYMAGDIKYIDVNQDGIIDVKDQVAIGYPTDPEIIYGFGASTGYKNFDISFFFQGSAHSSFFIQPSSIEPFAAHRNALKLVAGNYWSEENPDPHAFWPRLSTSIRSNNTVNSTWWLRNGSFLRLKTVEMGYSLPAKFTKKLGFEVIRFFASGNNLFCISDFKLWDPEMGGYGIGYPTQRVYNVGLNVEF
ncbi:MAG: TonB-dependent receptor [Prevotella sp.]|nr:TonB-dependent receptor [Prevotella sp.]